MSLKNIKKYFNGDNQQFSNYGERPNNFNPHVMPPNYPHNNFSQHPNYNNPSYNQGGFGTYDTPHSTQQLNRIEYQIAELNRQVNRLNRRVRRIENYLGFREELPMNDE